MTDIMDKLKAKFTSGNNMLVTGALLSVDEYREIAALVDSLEEALDKSLERSLIAQKYIKTTDTFKFEQECHDRFKSI